MCIRPVGEGAKRVRIGLVDKENSPQVSNCDKEKANSSTL
jgi:hypothetical protein